jgi:TPR repeat protein
MSSWRIGFLLLLFGCRHSDNATTKADKLVAVASTIAGCADLTECENGCRAGLANNCVEAGRQYEFGHAGPRDAARAFPLYERACKLGLPGGCFNAAVLLEAGNAIAQDTRRAAQLYAQVCLSGSKTACSRAAALTESSR